MTRFSLRLVMGLCSVCLGGCVGPTYQERQSTFEGQLNQYVGASSDELILRFGIPDQSAPLRDGGQVLSYSRAFEQISGGGTFTAYDTVRQKRVVTAADGSQRTVEERVQVPVERQTPITKSVLTCDIRWRVDGDGVVQDYAWDGNDCF
ncbi:MAG: hypothetical protein AAF337_04880 [Pseudomonadota bacterium]